MGKLRTFLNAFKNSELGQGLSEYCLITAVLALLALGIYVHSAGGIDAALAPYQGASPNPSEPVR